MPSADPTMEFVPAWVAALLSPLSSYVATTTASHGAIGLNACAISTSRRRETAWRCAVAIASRRLAPNPPLFFEWFAMLCWGDPIDERQALLLRTRLLVNVGTPTEPGQDAHVLGLVAEALWFEITKELDAGLGRPVLLEGHDWSVIDPGGDGLAVYRYDGELHFRLWESKAHDVGDAVRSTVNRACGQLRRRALEYLGRFSVVAQRVGSDEELARFVCELPERWVDNSPTAGVGVSVAAQEAADASLCFERMPEYFAFSADKQEGRLTIVGGELVEFARLVRSFLWQGAGLCSAP